jgi:hypothetical protein
LQGKPHRSVHLDSVSLGLSSGIGVGAHDAGSSAAAGADAAAGAAAAAGMNQDQNDAWPGSTLPPLGKVACSTWIMLSLWK